MSERYNPHIIDPRARETINRITIEAEFNDFYSNREIEDDELIILNSEGWRVVGYAFNLRGNNRFCNQYTLENVNSGERIIVNRNIISPLLQGFITRDGNYEYQMVESATFEIKKNLMDSKYPHKCFECGNPIQYKHAFKSACDKDNISIVNLRNHNYHKNICLKKAQKCYAFEKQFKKIWRSKYVQFFCCECYRRVNKQPTKMNHISISLDEGGRCTDMTVRDELDNNEYYENP